MTTLIEVLLSSVVHPVHPRRSLCAAYMPLPFTGNSFIPLSGHTYYFSLTVLIWPCWRSARELLLPLHLPLSSLHLSFLMRRHVIRNWKKKLWRSLPSHRWPVLWKASTNPLLPLSTPLSNARTPIKYLAYRLLYLQIQQLKQRILNL